MRNQLQSVFQSYGNSARNSTEDNVVLLELLSQLIPESLQEEWLENSTNSNNHCPESFIDSLPRINKKLIKIDDECPICRCNYLDDDYPLVVQLPHCNHKFDLECLAVWLSKSTSCPLCRDDVLSHKVIIDDSQAELEEFGGLYG